MLGQHKPSYNPSTCGKRAGHKTARNIVVLWCQEAGGEATQHAQHMSRPCQGCFLPTKPCLQDACEWYWVLQGHSLQVSEVAGANRRGKNGKHYPGWMVDLVGESIFSNCISGWGWGRGGLTVGI